MWKARNPIFLCPNLCIASIVMDLLWQTKVHAKPSHISNPRTFQKVLINLLHAFEAFKSDAQASKVLHADIGCKLWRLTHLVQTHSWPIFIDMDVSMWYARLCPEPLPGFVLCVAICFSYYLASLYGKDTKYM